jgi:spore maturation protein CgeB
VKLVIFGLTLSSSWGNGHATLWRGLCAALARAGHRVVFFERDAPYYAEHRDLLDPPGYALRLYPGWEAVAAQARREVSDADAAIVTSYCPDGIAATRLVTDDCPGIRCFYDLDTPVTLARLADGERVPYLGVGGLRAFDLVLSFTGGRALGELQTRLGARRVAPLYGHVDPEVHRPAARRDDLASDLSYLGTYAEDRQAQLDALFLAPARRLPARSFLIGGAQYPQSFPWESNVWFRRHVAPADHAAFYGSSRLTLNVTRATMARMGHCPSGRLFEAAACGAAILSDWFEGLDRFFAPGDQIRIAHGTEDAIAAIETSDAELAAMARRARERTLQEHTSAHRARELVSLLEAAGRGRPVEDPGAGQRRAEL